MTQHITLVSDHPRLANAKVRALREKLRALAERGIDGERDVARRKLAVLEARFDFGVANPSDAPDLFVGIFKRSTTARRVFVFGEGEYDVANSVKWAIESATGIACLFRGSELLAEANPATVKRLTKIASHVAGSFRALLERFSAVDGVNVMDRAAFVRGLYDGMMNQAREVGERLPSRPTPRKRSGRAKPAASAASQLGLHPYSLALGLGRQIRFSVPVNEIAAELEAACAAALPDGGARR